MWDPIKKKLTNWLSPLKNTEASLYLVGGAVRDREMGRAVTDMDLVCRDAKKVAEKIASVTDVALVRFLKNPEAPCYRLVNRLDKDDHIDVSKLRGKDISTDLAHRDFTINAMAIPIDPDGHWGETIDPFGGIIDIEKKRIRVTRPTVFNKDPLRMLRAVRFSAELGFSPATGTIDLIRLHADKIDQVAGERIWAEFKRILNNGNSRTFIRRMDEWSLLSGIFPEIAAMKDCPQNAHHHLDVWSHSLVVFGYCEEMINDPARYFWQHAELIQNHLATNDRDVLLKLAALLHDVGKPITRGYDPVADRITFYGHDKTGAGMAEEIARRLRLSKADRIFLVTLVAEHLHILTLAMPEVKPSTRMRLFRTLKDDTISLIIHGMADILATRGPDSSSAYRKAYLRWANATIATFHQSIKPRLSPKNDLIRGKDLIDLGMPPGPGIGTVLSRIRNAQDNDEIQNRTDALLMAKALMTATDGKTKTRKSE